MLGVLKSSEKCKFIYILEMTVIYLAQTYSGSIYMITILDTVYISHSNITGELKRINSTAIKMFVQ